MEILEVVDGIHRGGFGIIDHVICEDGKGYARKTFDPLYKDRYDKSTIDGLRKRFVREVMVQKELPEELFIPIYFANLFVEKPWFIMPIADMVFENEIERCRKENTNPDGLADILNALEHLHELGYVHRDLKPANVLYHKGRWKLADLGLITPKEDLTSTLTSTNDFAGTAKYCAPEQLNDFKHVTHHADIYSFGAILHDIYNGGDRIPYTKLTSTGDIGLIIEKCTEPKIGRRFNNVASLRSSLLGVLSKENNKPILEVTKDWLIKLEFEKEWTSEMIEEFYFYIRKRPEERFQIFWELLNENFEVFYSGDRGYWKSISLLFLDWVVNRSFDFNYCDVLINRMWFIYNQSDDLELKAEVALVSSRLGCSHNRWYVMEHVVKMCGPQISINLAKRIAIEIKIGGSPIKRYFHRCVEGISRTPSSYHPLIAEVFE